MKAKDLIEKLKSLDPETELTVILPEFEEASFDINNLIICNPIKYKLNLNINNTGECSINPEINSMICTGYRNAFFEGAFMNQS